MAPLLASDGLIARDSGPWAEEKLHQVQSYMGIFTKGMWQKWDGALVFLDLMAGPGRCVDRDTRREFPGSPILALRTARPFRAIACVEFDAANHAALQARVASEPRGALAEVIHGDTNAPAVIDRLRTLSDNALAFAFIDLIGQEIAFDTIARLTADRNIDLMISFPEMDLQRNSPLVEITDPERWTRFFGTEAWRPIVNGPRRLRVLHLLRLYQQQLGRLGYETRPARQPMKNSRGRSIYRLLFASRNPRGIDFYTKATALDPGGQRALDL